MLDYYDSFDPGHEIFAEHPIMLWRTDRHQAQWNKKIFIAAVKTQ